MTSKLDTLIEEASDLPRIIAINFVLRKNWYLPNGIDIDDLIQAGALGLLDAASKYDEKKGKWMSYAHLRITGAIVDWMRSVSWSSRTDRINAKENNESMKRMYAFSTFSGSQKEQDFDDDDEKSVIEEITCDFSSEKEIKDFELKELLAWFIENLSKEDIYLVNAFYLDNIPFVEIQKKLNLSEGAVYLRIKRINKWLKNKANNVIPEHRELIMKSLNE